MPLASARQHPENQKENQAGHSSERTVEGHSFRDPWVVLLIGWLLPLGFGLGGCLLLARRGRAYVQFTIINARAQARPIATPVACVVL